MLIIVNGHLFIKREGQCSDSNLRDERQHQ